MDIGKSANFLKRSISIVLCCLIMLSSVVMLTSFINDEQYGLLPASVSVEKAIDDFNLSKMGDRDWVYPLGEKEIRKHKVNDENTPVGLIKIEQLTTGKDYKAIKADKSPVNISFSDGTPEKQGNGLKDCVTYRFKDGDKTSAFKDISEFKAGYKITVPASDNAQVLTFISGAYQAESAISVYVNGEEKPIFVNKDIKADNSNVTRKFTINVRPKNEIVIECLMNKKKNENGFISLNGIACGKIKVSDNIKINCENAFGQMNLSQVGDIDWLHISGTTQDASSQPVYVRKNIEQSLINFSLMKDCGALTKQTDSKVAFSWNDGIAGFETAENSSLGGVVTYMPGDVSSVGIIPSSKEVGYTIDISASEDRRKLTFVTGVWEAKGEISIYLNDSSVAAHGTSISANGDAVANIYTVNLEKGDSAKVKFTLKQKTNVYGNIAISAIALGTDNKGIDYRKNLESLCADAENFDPEGINESVVGLLNAELANAKEILKDSSASDDKLYESYVFLNYSYDKAITLAGERKYSNISSPGLVSSFGWEGDKHAPIAYIDGTYKLRDNGDKIINFGVWDIKEKINWYNKEGYLPCFVSEFSKNELSHIVENFADLVIVDGKKYEIAYSRMTTVNNSNEEKNLPKVSNYLTPLNNRTKDTKTIKKGETIVRDYAISADRFDNTYEHLTGEEIIGLGDFESHYNHMKEYWNTRLDSIAAITKLPDEKLINAYKAGYIYTLIIRDDINKNGGVDYQLHVGENGYDEMYDHDTIGIVAALLTMGDFQFAKEYLASLPAQLQYDDAKWKYSWPYALYYQKTGDLEFIKQRFEDIKKNTHFVESDRINNGTGILKKTNAIDSNGYWLIDNWAALTGLTTYNYLCNELFSKTGDSDYKAEGEWAKAQYKSLLSEVEKAQKELRDKFNYDYISISMEVPTEQSDRKDPKDANWASMFLFGRWTWDGYLFGADQSESEMINLIDDTYTHGFERRAKLSDTIYNFGGYPHGYFSSAYNAGYGSAALRGEEYRDCGIKAYQFMINEAMSGPYGWWEGVDYPNNNSPWSIDHAAGGGGSCQHMWGQSTASKVLVDSLISEKADKTAIIGRGIPVEWVVEGEEIQIENYPVAQGKFMGYNLKTQGNKVILTISGDNSQTPISFELLTFKNNIASVLGDYSFNNEKGVITIPAGVKSVEVTLINPSVKNQITIDGGTSDKQSAVAGEIVTINATVPSGKVFEKWVSEDGVVFASENTVSTTFKMPAKPVKISAVFKDKPVSYKISVENGFCENTASYAGNVIEINAEDAPYGMVFDKWVCLSENVVFDDEFSENTTFVMPKDDVKITATYIKISTESSEESFESSQDSDEGSSDQSLQEQTSDNNVSLDNISDETNKTSTENVTVPNTGDETKGLSVIFGIISLFAISLIMVKRYYKKFEN